MTLLFLIFLTYIFVKLAGFAFRASWSIFKFTLWIVFLPFTLAIMAIVGMMHIALPILLVVALFGLFQRA